MVLQWMQKSSHESKCMVAILPFVRMSMASSSVTTAIFKTGCDHDEQCAQHGRGVCNSHMALWYGIHTRPTCNIQNGINQCVCGVFVDHVIRPEECTAKDMPGKFAAAGRRDLVLTLSLACVSHNQLSAPHWALSKQDKDGLHAEHSSFVEEAATETATATETVAATDTAQVAVAEGEKGAVDWFKEGKRFPMWQNDNSNDKYCALGWLPYVRCSRSGLNIKTCSKDESCLCERGCPGPSQVNPSLQWTPMCFKRGMNQCMCALISTTIGSQAGCMMPSRHTVNKVPLFYAEDDHQIGKSWWSEHINVH